MSNRLHISAKIHVKGKTKWSAYEKANIAYVYKNKGWNVNKIAELCGQSETTIQEEYKNY